MIPSGIEPATFRFVAQHLNHCATSVPVFKIIWTIIVLRAGFRENPTAQLFLIKNITVFGLLRPSVL
jgi:hypothetical protein